MSGHSNSWKPHSAKQDAAIFSTKPIIALCTGIQFGKTMAGAVRMKIEMTKHTAEDDAFIVCAPTYKILNQSTLPAFINIMKDCGEYKKGDAVFEMRGGGKCYMRTATDPDSVVGITNVRFIWGDEAGKYPLYFWQNIQARAAFKKAPVMLTTSPYSLNWLYRELIRPKMRDFAARSDVELIQARSDENPYFPLEIYERNRKTMDTRMFNKIFGGEWSQMEGLVYDCFDEQFNVVDPFALPEGTRFYGGVDWGYTNPFALAVRAITPDGTHYQISETYLTGLTVKDMVEVVKKKLHSYPIEAFYCDPSAPAYIEEFNRNGLTAIAADNDIRKGIDIHYELIKTHRWKIFRGSSPHTIDELENYHYRDDTDTTSPDADIKETLPVKQFDHLMDVHRYMSVALYRPTRHKPVIIDDKPNVPKSKTLQDVVKNVRTPFKPHVGPDTEEWS